jgi:hypothetical protein
VEVFVQRLAGVLLEVGAGERMVLVDVADLDVEAAALDDRQLVLADLIALGQVGVEVVLAGEDVALDQLGADGQAEADAALDRAAC